MTPRWVLQTNLNGTYSRSVWQTQAGAIADRERQVKPRRQKIRGQWKTIHPLGWTAITRIGREEA